MNHNNDRRTSKRKYSIGVQIFLSIFLLFYIYLIYFSFFTAPQGSPLADHPYTPWDFEMTTIKLLFLLFLIGYYFSWKSRLISGLVYLAWCFALYWQVVTVAKMLHVAGDGIMFIFPVLPVAVFLIITGLKEKWERSRPQKPAGLSNLLLLFSFLLNGCVLIPGHGFSESKKSRSAGENLGFESAKEGMPVNWAFKTKRVISNMSKNGDVVDFDMIVDTADAKEGTRSIRYVIRKCTSTRENMKMYAYYPGFFHEFERPAGSTYRVTFWVKNDGCEFEVLTSAVREMGGPKCEGHSAGSKESITQWKQFTVDQTICPGMKFLRIEVNIKSPGIFQIDAFNIEKVN